MKYPRLFQWLVLAAIVILAGPGTKPGLAAEVKSAAPADWEKTVKAAGEEGALTIYMTQAFEPVFREAFQKKFPQIKFNTVVGRDFQLGQQVMAERRAEKYLVDLCITGNITPVTVFHKAKILDPIRPLLVLPEVVNESVWFEGEHHYYDPEDLCLRRNAAQRRADLQYQARRYGRHPLVLESAGSEMERSDRHDRSIGRRPDQFGRRFFSISIRSSAPSFSSDFTGKRK
jgi:hypothetical protein